MEEQWPTWCCSYWLDGKQYGFKIVAKDLRDAERRLAAIGRIGTVDGQLMATIPASFGWWVPAVVWVRNVLRMG